MLWIILGVCFLLLTLSFLVCWFLSSFASECAQGLYRGLSRRRRNRRERRRTVRRFRRELACAEDVLTLWATEDSREDS